MWKKTVRRSGITRGNPIGAPLTRKDEMPATRLTEISRRQSGSLTPATEYDHTREAALKNFINKGGIKS